MLGTFSFEPYFKSYLCFTVWSLEILEILFWSLSPSSSSLLCFPLRRCAERRPRRLPPRSHLQLRCRLTWHPRVALDLLPPPIASRCTSPARATRPSELHRLPPQRRRGGLSAVPWAPILRASQHPWRPSIAIHSPSRSLSTPNPQNIAAAPRELRRAHPRRRPATTDPLHPHQPHHPLCLVLA